MAEDKKKGIIQTKKIQVKLPPTFYFTGGRDYEMAIKRFMTHPTTEEKLFEDSFGKKKAVEGTIRPIHRISGMSGFKEGLAVSARLQYIPLLQFYSVERVLSMDVQQAGKLLSQIEKRVADGKLVMLNTNIKIGDEVIPQYFRPDQVKEIRLAGQRPENRLLKPINLSASESVGEKVNRLKQSLGGFESEKIPKMPMTAQPIEPPPLKPKGEIIFQHFKSEKVGELLKPIKKLATTAWKHPLTKNIIKLPLMEAQALNDIISVLAGGHRLPYIGSLSKTAQDIAKSLEKSTKVEGVEKLKELKKIPKKIIKTRLSHGGRVSAIPYAVGGKVYSQAIRKPKLI